MQSQLHKPLSTLKYIDQSFFLINPSQKSEKKTPISGVIYQATAT